MIRLFRVFVPASVVALLFAEIVLIFCCYILPILLLTDEDLEVFLLYDGGFTRVALVVASVLFGLYFLDLYTNLRVKSNIMLVQQLCLVVGVVFLGQALINYIDPLLSLPQTVVIAGSALVLTALPLWRILYSSVVLRGVGAQRILFAGNSPVVAEIANRLIERPELGFNPIGYLADQESATLLPVPQLGVLKDLREVVAHTHPDRIVVGLSERRQRLPVYDLLDLRLSGIPIEEVASTYEMAFGRVCTSELKPSQLIFSAELGPRRHSVRLQRLYSFLIALVGTIVTAPLMMMVAILIKLTSPGPILYRQTRVGHRDVPFTVYKFRSMRADAEAKTGAVWAKTDDPRITRFGKWMRKVRLDELPQFFNVLRGDMSIVGPRPERPEFVKTLNEQIPFYRQRHCVKPGITGWAQINHKYGDSLEDTIIKLEYDLYYIKNLAPSLDAYIIFHTLKVMLLSRGAQ
jgi:sugar transferase (PEP-CTERM system associated)